jgi:acetoin utilization deacetylase AcuC-like enzyme
MILISSGRFAEHHMPPGHPERSERAVVMEQVASRWRQQGYDVRTPRAATQEELERVHAPEYVGMIAELAGRAVALDSDTYTSAESYEIARLAAGASLQAVELALGRDASEGPGSATAVALVRPPGHHAGRSRAMGFCLFNNVAAAAAHARTLGAARVAVVDYDVHHGNGTQDIFEADPDVLFVSLHQFPFYPGTGAADEIGRGAGAGFTVNVPLEVGALDRDYHLAFSEVVLPVLQQYRPDVMLVSAGFDAHERDPLAGMRLTEGAFAAMTRELREVADQCCNGRLALVTEGGYDLLAIDRALEAVLDALSGSTDAPWPPEAGAARRGREAVTAVKQALGPFWKFG